MSFKTIVIWGWTSLCRFVKENPFEWNIGSIVVVFLLGWIFSKWFYCKYKKDKSKSHQLINSLPNIWTSLGLLGTFISIVLSLGDISDEIQIVEIIHSIIPAFTTSIVGLVGALYYTIKNKKIYRKEDESIYNSIENKTPEEILSEINGKIDSNIKQQNDLLTQFIGNFIERMNNIFAPIEGQVKNYSKDLIEKADNNNRELIEKQSENVQAYLKNTSDSVKESVTKLKSQIDGCTLDIKETYQHYRDQFNSLMVCYNLAVENYDKAVKNVVNNNENIQNTITIMKNGMSEVGKTNGEVRKTYDLLLERQENVEKLTAEIKSMKSAIDTLRQIESQLNAINQKMRN